MKIVWRETAIANLRNQIVYLEEYSPRAALEATEMILAAIERLSAYPELGRAGRVRNTRELVVGGTPYLVAYRIQVDTILILALLHGAQRWPSRL